MVRIFVAVLLASAFVHAVAADHDALAAWIVVLVVVCEALTYLPTAWRQARRPPRSRPEADR